MARYNNQLNWNVSIYINENFSRELKLNKINTLLRNILKEKGEKSFMIHSMCLHFSKMFYFQTPENSFACVLICNTVRYEYICVCVFSARSELPHILSDKSKDHFLPSLFIIKCNSIFLHIFTTIDFRKNNGKTSFLDWMK